jgi:putative heme-binding domain-containing protein
LTSINTRAGGVLRKLLASRSWLAEPGAGNVLSAIVAQIVRQRREADLDVLLAALESSSNVAPESVSMLVRSLSRLPAGALSGDDSPQLAKLARLRHSTAAALVLDARRVLEQQDAEIEQRVRAIQDLALGRFEDQEELLDGLLSPQEPAAVHAAVLDTCADYDAPGVADLVLARWPQFGPAERSQATELLLRRAVWALALLEYLESEGVPLTTLDPAHAARLHNYPAKRVRELARTLRGQSVSEDRQQVFDEYREAVLAGGDATHGRRVFDANCAACHELAGSGHPVGPNLASMVSRGSESVLFNILAPSSEVDPRFLEYIIMTTDGQVFTGMIAGETSTAVTLRSADNKTTTILRVDIEEMQNTGKSFMPEGFEKAIDKQAMADLLAYLQQAAAADGASP